MLIPGFSQDDFDPACGLESPELQLGADTNKDSEYVSERNSQNLQTRTRPF